MICPRCGSQLWRSLEPSYGHCIYHGDVFCGTPPPREPNLARGKRKSAHHQIKTKERVKA